MKKINLSSIHRNLKKNMCEKNPFVKPSCESVCWPAPKSDTSCLLMSVDANVNGSGSLIANKLSPIRFLHINSAAYNDNSPIKLQQISFDAPQTGSSVSMAFVTTAAFDTAPCQLQFCDLEFQPEVNIITNAQVQLEFADTTGTFSSTGFPAPLVAGQCYVVSYQNQSTTIRILTTQLTPDAISGTFFIESGNNNTLVPEKVSVKFLAVTCPCVSA